MSVEPSNLLIASGKFDDVVIVPLAFSGSEVMRWAKGGDINRFLVDTAKQLELAPYRVTDVLWVQGEIDYVRGTSEDVYHARFLSMVDNLRAQKIEAPVYVSITSKCLEPSNGGFKVDASDNPIVRAQLTLSTSGNGIKRGVNTDALLDEIDRYDDCHMGGSGEQKVAQAWADLLLADQVSSSGNCPNILTRSSLARDTLSAHWQREHPTKGSKLVAVEWCGGPIVTLFRQFRTWTISWVSGSTSTVWPLMSA